MKILRKLFRGHEKTTPLLHEDDKTAKKVQKAIKSLSTFNNIVSFCAEKDKKKGL